MTRPRTSRPPRHVVACVRDGFRRRRAGSSAPAPSPRGAEAAGGAAPERQGVLRDARAQRARLHQPVQRHVLRREDRRHRDHPARRADVHRRSGPTVADAGAVGPDPEAGRPEGRQGHQHHHVRDALRGVRFRLPAGRDARGIGLPRRHLRRQAGPGEARGSGGAQPRVPAVQVLRAHLPRRRQARHLPALPDRDDEDQVRRDEDPPVRGLQHLRRSRSQRVRRSRPGCCGQDVRPRTRGSRAPRHDPGPLRRPPASRRKEPLPERLVHRPFAAGDEDDREGGGVAGPPERHPGLDADPGHPVLASRLSPDAEEDRGRRARHERHGAARRRRSSR